MKPQTFFARIFGRTEDEFQDVYGYILYEEADIADVEIKMPLFVLPSDIRTDVGEWLRDYKHCLQLGNLHFSIVPQNQLIAP
jgi:hypothetical protein